MKIAIDWIGKYLDRPIDAAEAQHALIHGGLPVENIHEFAGVSVLDVEVTSNRTDCFSHIGLARELAALTRRGFQPPAIEEAPSASSAAASGRCSVEVLDSIGCPFYCACVIEDVVVQASPDWLRHAVESVGLRSINNVVDITNYLLMDTGQPLHAFDLDRLAGHRVVVRRACDGEAMVSIDGRSHKLDATMLVIADAEKPAAIAGIMGGKASEVTHSTRRILLEAAHFNAGLVRATARRLGLFSDSSFRFERGIDPAAAAAASQRAVKLIAEVCGGKPVAGRVVVGGYHAEPLTVALRPAQIKRIIGMEIPREQVMAVLRRLWLSPTASGDRIVCQIPSFRSDITREIDLIEEIIRLHGYQHVPVKSQVSHPVGHSPAAEQAQRKVRRTLEGAGWHETVSHSLVDAAEAELFLDVKAARPIRVADESRKEANTLRPSVWTGLLRAYQHNQNNGCSEPLLFEQAGVYWQPVDDFNGPPHEESRLALVGHDLALVRGALEAVVAQLHGAARLEVLPMAHVALAAGASGEALLRGAGESQCRRIGFIGQFCAAAQAFYALRHAVYGFEVQWGSLVAAYEPTPQAVALPRFPMVCRDLSVVVAEAVPWAAIASAITAVGAKYLDKVNFQGVYRGKQVGVGLKSVTLSLDFLNTEATLRSAEVEEQMGAIVAALRQGVSAELRV